MALNSTIIRFKIDVSDVDRSIYETLELRVARHPSESGPFFLTRMIAYALNVQEGIVFSDGISAPDDAAIYVKDLTGKILTWIDIGNPSAKRLNKATKAAPLVKIYTYRDPQLIRDEIAREKIHRQELVEVFALSPKFLTALEQTLERDNAWTFLYDNGDLSITVKGETLHDEISVHRLN